MYQQLLRAYIPQFVWKIHSLGEIQLVQKCIWLFRSVLGQFSIVSITSRSGTKTMKECLTLLFRGMLPIYFGYQLSYNFHLDNIFCISFGRGLTRRAGVKKGNMPSFFMT